MSNHILGKEGEQFELFDKKEEPSEVIKSVVNEVVSKKDDRISCQYCEDVGPCMYCKRGHEAVRQLKNSKKA